MKHASGRRQKERAARTARPLVTAHRDRGCKRREWQGAAPFGSVGQLASRKVCTLQLHRYHVSRSHQREDKSSQAGSL